MFQLFNVFNARPGSAASSTSKVAAAMMTPTNTMPTHIPNRSSNALRSRHRLRVPDRARTLDQPRWLWGAILFPLLLHVAIVYVPFLQETFSTVALGAGDWLVCAVVASSVVWLRELSKILTRAVWPEPDADPATKTPPPLSRCLTK